MTTPRSSRAKKAPVEASLDVLWGEGELQNFVLRLARTCGWLAYHTRFSLKSQPGFPDLVLVKPPRVIFAELKDARRKLTESRLNKWGHWVTGQDEWLAALAKCPGVEAYLWRPGDVEDIQRELTR